jgi:hypothetical protein
LLPYRGLPLRTASEAAAQAEHVDVVRLSDAAQAADPLLDPHRVPRQIKVAHGVRELQIPAFAAGFGT